MGIKQCLSRRDLGEMTLSDCSMLVALPHMRTSPALCLSAVQTEGCVPLMSAGLMVTFLFQPPAPEAGTLCQQPGVRQNDRTSSPALANWRQIGQFTVEKGVGPIVLGFPQPSTLAAKDHSSK